MTLKHQYDSQSDIPEPFRELFSEKGGKWEVTGITGLRTQSDVDRATAALEKERELHKEAKSHLKSWSELGDIDELHQKLDRLPELEAASKGKLDEAQIEDLVTRRVDGVIKSRTSPLERQVSKLQKERDDLNLLATGYAEQDRTRKIHDEIRRAASVEKLLAPAIDDVLIIGERLFEVAEDGAVVTRDGVGVTPGLPAKDWLSEVRDRKPHWWPGSTGGGASGSGPRGGINGSNPFTADNWSLTEQGRFVREHGAEKAAEAAKAAGTSLGGQRPTAKA